MTGPSPFGYARNPETGEVRVQTPAALMRRHEASLPPGDALDAVQAALAVATVMHRHHDDGGRLGVYWAVRDVVNYLASQGVPYATLEPLTAVAAALVDADSGIESSIFRPQRVGGGAPPTPVSTLAFEGLLAVVTECCIRHCRDEGQWPYREAGERLAASLVNASPLRISVDAKTLRNIRERVRRQRNRSSPDRLQYDISLASPVAQRQPLDWAKLLVAHPWVAAPNS